MLDSNPVNVYRVRSNPERIPFEHVRVTDWLQRLTADEGRDAIFHGTLPDNVYRLRPEESDTFPVAADQLLLNYRVAIAELSSSWCTETNFFQRFIDAKPSGTSSQLSSR